MKLMNQTEKLISSKLSAAKRRSTLVGRERKFSESSGSGSKVNTRRASTIVTPFEAVTDGSSSALLKSKSKLNDFMGNPSIKRRSALINYDMDKINRMI